MQDDHDDLHDRGLHFDLSVLTDRRNILGVIGLTGAITLLGAGSFGGPPGDAEADTTGRGADGATCVKNPGETAGPFPADGSNARDGQTVNVLAQSGVIRADLRPSFGGLVGMAEGTGIALSLRLVDVKGGCRPLAGYAVYLWHADAQGRYSLYDLPDQNYLRGVAVSDADGIVRFTTIFPGCYDGRWPHMHFEVFSSVEAAASGRAAILTSQLAFPEAVARDVYRGAAYDGSAANIDRVSLMSDMVFGNNTPAQLEQQTVTISGSPAAGLTAEAMVGVVV